MSCPTLGDAYAANWAQRVENNGGARPAQATINAAATFFNDLVTAGIHTKMYAVNFFAPDSLTAAITPFFTAKSLDPWTNANFVAGDLTVNGLVGNGSNKKLTATTNAQVQSLPAFDHGTSIYVTRGINEAVGEWGTYNAPNLLAVYNYSNTTYCDIGDSTGAGRVSQANPLFTGFLSGNRLANNNLKLFRVATNAPFAEIGSNTGVQAAYVGGLPAMTAFAINGIAGYSVKRLSFAALHAGLTSTEAEALYNAVQDFRVTVTGGFVPEIDNAYQIALDWANRVEVNGGARPSQTSIDAAETFWQELIDANIHTKFKAVNFYAPDSITAAITPLYKGVGNDPWTNPNGFTGADLSVNGLKGDSLNARYLITGVVPATALTDFDCGYTVYIHTGADDASLEGVNIGAPFTGGMLIYGTLGGNVLAGLPNGNAITAAAVPNPYTGYLSMNRTANNVFKLYGGRSNLGHTELGSQSTPQAAWIGSLIWPFYTFAHNAAGGGASAFVVRRNSFAAIHTGLSQADSSALYNAVQALRTTLGGGFV